MKEKKKKEEEEEEEEVTLFTVLVVGLASGNTGRFRILINTYSAATWPSSGRSGQTPTVKTTTNRGKYFPPCRCSGFVFG